jgi:hypothetical protein
MLTHAERAQLEREARREDERSSAPRDPRLQALLLQQTAGNAAVGRLLSRRHRHRPPPATAAQPPAQTRVDTQTYELKAAIRIGEPRARRPERAAVGADQDSEAGHMPEEELTKIEAVAGEPLAATTLAAPATAPPEVAAPSAVPDAAPPGTPPSAPEAAEHAVGAERNPAEEAPVSLPDFEVRDFAEVELCDAITPWLSYQGTIAQGGNQPSGFGVTRPGPMTVTGITVRKLPVLGWWYVSATVTQRIEWQVRPVTGPSGQVNIMSALDPAITAANWKTVVSDLTPDMSDLNGRPPRSQFWAKDLTEQHEAFHANDRKTRAPAALRLASNWLGTQQAADPAGVQALLQQVPGRMVATVAAGMTMPGKEERAYGDGAGAYSRRATAIWALGNIGYYP